MANKKICATTNLIQQKKKTSKKLKITKILSDEKSFRHLFCPIRELKFYFSFLKKMFSINTIDLM